MVHRRGIIIMLSQLPNAGVMRPNRLADPGGDTWNVYVWVEDANALYNEFIGKGVRIAREICDHRDFDIEDCNGYRLCFGHDIEGK